MPAREENKEGAYLPVRAFFMESAGTRCKIAAFARPAVGAFPLQENGK
jgi:hypothetical protein